MKLMRPALIALVGLLGVGWLVARQDRAPVQVGPAKSDGPIRGLIAAQPFELVAAATHYWRAERPQYTRGWLLVLECDPALLARRQTSEALLASSGELLERLNEGAKHGRVVAILPSWDAREPRSFAFVNAERPEAVDAGMAASLWQDARSLCSVDADQWSRALTLGGGPIRFEDRTQLEEHAARWILEHAPEDSELAEGWLAPR